MVVNQYCPGHQSKRMEDRRWEDRRRDQGNLVDPEGMDGDHWMTEPEPARRRKEARMRLEDAWEAGSDSG